MMMGEKHTTADRHKQNTCFYVFGGRWRTAEEAEYATKLVLPYLSQHKH